MSKRKPESGAKQRQQTSTSRLKSLWQSHRAVALLSIRKLIGEPAASAMTIAVIGIALLLPTTLFVAMNNLQILSEGVSESSRITLYLADTLSEAEGRSLSEQLLARPDISTGAYISPTQAAEEFREYSGLGDVLSELEENPLPAVIVLSPQDIDEASGAALLTELNALAGVESAQLDLEWIARLQRFLDLAQRMSTALMLILALAVLFVVGNTIRLAIESRRAEIVVVKLVGGTDSYVARPFLYTGFWYGLGGGVLAWLLLSLIMLALGGPLAALLALYDNQHTVHGLSLLSGLVLLTGSALLGWLGAWISVRQHLAAIEPR
ncbi:MAG: permease-like cell division protein FtsX [Gammaproteobacteria bacterium]|nr:permease-like cell division protein FtsX [Gammaproteobacteria bacterium]MDO9318413.1 permease-like cell division protein FtsX [Gammaproteobacteria bacterium]